MDNIQPLTFLFSPRKLIAEMVKYEVRSRAFNPVISSAAPEQAASISSLDIYSLSSPTGTDLLVLPTKGRTTREQKILQDT